MRAKVSFLVLTLALAVSTTASDIPRPGKPRLSLRATPRFAMSPVSVLVTAELVGGDELEEFHCPGMEWDWGDGTRSFHESDCAPYEAGTGVARHFSNRHVYRAAGAFKIRLTMRRATRAVARAATNVQLRSRTGF